MSDQSGCRSGPVYQAEVPDTLDLAGRAALAVNSLTGSADPNRNYESFLCAHLDKRPPYFSHRAGGPCLAKPVHALPMMRVMSGSTLRAHYDLKMLEAGLNMIEDDGLLWLKVEGRPGYGEGWGEDLAMMNLNPRFMVALMDWYKYDGDSRWMEVAGRIADGLARIAQRNEDRAWYHLCYSRSGFREDTSPSAEIMGELGTDRPTVVEPEKAHIYTNGHPLRAFSRWYAETGDKKALDLAHRIASFMLKPATWGTTEGPTMAAQAEHGMWHGHFHSYTMGMKGMAEYAIVTNDTRALEFVAKFYEWGRYYGISRIGFFPAVVRPLQAVADFNRKMYGSTAQVCEGCSVGNMTWLAVRLSEAGIGDYWEDADRYVRNHLVEHQFIRRDHIEDMIAGGPEHEIDRRWESVDDVVGRCVGSFASVSDPTWLYGTWTMCCTANIPMGLYKAWEAIVRCSGDVAQVNLLLNRASAWLDVDSYLPYEGKVVLKNKTARKVHVRMPRWADKKAVRCWVNEGEIYPQWLNNYLTIEGLRQRDVVTIEFPIVETVEKHTEMSYEQEYTCRLKGNTLVDISPRPGRPAFTKKGSDDGGGIFPVNKGYPIYERDFYRADKAPMKKVERYIAPTII